MILAVLALLLHSARSSIESAKLGGYLINPKHSWDQVATLLFKNDPHDPYFTSEDIEDYYRSQFNSQTGQTTS